MSISFPLLLVGVAVAAAALALAKPKPKAKRARLPDQGTIAGYDYFVEHVGGAVRGDQSPAVIAFHGRGGTSEGIADWMRDAIDQPAHLIVPTGKETLGNNNAWWLERAASADQGQLAAEMAWAAQDLKPFLQKVRAAYGKPIVAGHSQGAMMAALLAAQHPRLIKNAVGAAAWLPRDLQTGQTAPLTVVHGMNDSIIPYPRTRDWIKELAFSGAPVELVEVPGAGHSFTQLRDVFARELAGAFDAL